MADPKWWQLEPLDQSKVTDADREWLAKREFLDYLCEKLKDNGWDPLSMPNHVNLACTTQILQIDAEADPEQKKYFYTMKPGFPQHRFYTAQELLDALNERGLQPRKNPVQGMEALTNIHERVKQLESLYQTRLAMMQ